LGINKRGRSIINGLLVMLDPTEDKVLQGYEKANSCDERKADAGGAGKRDGRLPEV
jgi:hypothetical protein